jgi:3-methyl-2-oxobutanoate hydroxymethyltransferase
MSATARKTAPMPQDALARNGRTPLVSLTADTTPKAEVSEHPFAEAAPGSPK